MDYLTKLKKAEKDEIVRVMAFMSYNPSIGRVLQGGGVKKFQKFSFKYVGKLASLRNQTEFDRLHKKWVHEFISKIKTNKNKKCSYGQAQKAINVYLKVYVDWSKKPNQKKAKKMVTYLHVPLDKYMMGAVKREFLEKFNKFIADKFGKRIVGLSKINEKRYLAWQKMLREIYPNRPILLDIAWALERKKERK